MKFEKNFGQKHSFEALWKWQSEKNIHKISQDQSDPGFMQEKVQKGDFLKKPWQELENYFLSLDIRENALFVLFPA